MKQTEICEVKDPKCERKLEAAKDWVGYVTTIVRNGKFYAVLNDDTDPTPPQK